MKMRLNGWSRIGIVLSALWMFGVIIYFFAHADGPGYYDTEVIGKVVIAALFPVAAFWTICIVGLYTIHWVRDGFRTEIFNKPQSANIDVNTAPEILNVTTEKAPVVRSHSTGNYIWLLVAILCLFSMFIQSWDAYETGAKTNRAVGGIIMLPLLTYIISRRRRIKNPARLTIFMCIATIAAIFGGSMTAGYQRGTEWAKATNAMVESIKKYDPELANKINAGNASSAISPEIIQKVLAQAGDEQVVAFHHSILTLIIPNEQINIQRCIANAKDIPLTDLTRTELLQQMQVISRLFESAALQNLMSKDKITDDFLDKTDPHEAEKIYGLISSKVDPSDALFNPSKLSKLDGPTQCRLIMSLIAAVEELPLHKRAAVFRWIDFLRWRANK